MAIQFFCAACKQPIEVDDDFANQAVTCPYCRKVVTAPPLSDLSVTRQAAEAREPGAPAPDSDMPPFTPVLINNWGWVALGCLTGVLVILAIFCGTALSIIRELPKDMPPEQMQKAMADEMQARSGLQYLSYAMLALLLVGNTAALYCLAKKKVPRWPAIATLVVLVPVMLCFCFSIVMQVSQALSQGAPLG